MVILKGNGKESECRFYLGSFTEMANQLKMAM
jgi:hypothetical protein